jgi:hypothetical protein
MPMEVFVDDDWVGLPPRTVDGPGRIIGNYLGTLDYQQHHSRQCRWDVSDDQRPHLHVDQAELFPQQQSRPSFAGQMEMAFLPKHLRM